MAEPVRFLLNATEVVLTDCGADDTLLDFLRLNQRMTGTKEGCAEGDCGACTVLVGRLGRGGLHYAPVNACIRFLAACHGCHVVTVEHLRGPVAVGAGGAGGECAGVGLHPVQQAMVDHHGSQCGFCTPGIVMALYGLWMETARPSVAQIETALQGNLCRCTGYEPIVRAAQAAAEAGGQGADRLAAERAEVAARLRAIPAARVETQRDGQPVIIPHDENDLAAVLAQHPQATLVAGATDVGLWVTKFLRPIAPAVHIGHLMREAGVDDGVLSIGAGVTYSELLPLIDAHLPALAPYLRRIGGWQVRNAATVGGNIANGSPIGDMPPLLIALGARLALRHGAARREVALEDYFIAYGRQDRQPGEFVERVLVPLPGPERRVAAYKLSKRADADITAVAMGLAVTVREGRIAEARAAFGGMAGTPLRARAAEAALTGQPFGAAAFEAAAEAVGRDFMPLSDWRASADYRRRVAANLFRRFWLEQSGAPAVRLERERA